MKIDTLDKELQKKVVTMLNEAEDKSEAIYQAAVMIAEEQHKHLISELVEENARAAADEDYRKKLGLRVLTKEETSFYEKFKDIKQAITAEQIDILPTSIIDRTLDDIKKSSDILSMVQMAPADVKKWIKELLLAETGEHTIANHEIMNLAEEYQLDAKQISEIYEALHEMDIGITFDEDAVSEDGSTLIPKELEEAAKVDGCSRIGTMYKIVFPLALPGIISTTIFTFAMCWGEYMYALVNLTSSQIQTFPLVISGLIYGDMPPWNQLMAGGVLAGIPIIVIYMLASSGLVGGATDGGVKG